MKVSYFFILASIILFAFMPIFAFAQSPTEQRLLIDASRKLLDGNKAFSQGDKARGNALFSDAIVLYSKVLETDPDNLSVLNLRGNAKNYIQSGTGNADFTKVIELASAAIQINPKNAKAYHARAKAKAGLKMYTEARQDFKTAIELKPDERSWTTDLKVMEFEAGS